MPIDQDPVYAGSLKRFDIACEHGHCHDNAQSDRKTGEPEGMGVKELRLMIANCSQMTPISSKICVPRFVATLAAALPQVT